MMHYHKAILLIIAAIIGVCVGQDNFYPNGLVTQSGSASDVSLTALATKDQSGNQDNWDKYVEFYGHVQKYQGVFSFPVDVSCDAPYHLNMNFRGPAKTEQWWVFEWFIPSSNSYVLAGNNSEAKDWAWTSLSFESTVEFSTLVSSANVVQLRMRSLSVTDDCDLDFLQLSVNCASTYNETSDGSEGTETVVSPTSAPSHATQAPTHAPAAPTHAPTSAPVAPTHAPTSAPVHPTVAPTHAPAATPKPTARPTSAPTQPTTKPTTAPTNNPTSIPINSPSVAPTTGGRFCPSGTHYRPGPYTTWQWQLSGTVDTTVAVQLYDIDMFGSSTSLIATLHNKGIAVICYIDTAYEPGRPDSSEFTAAVLGNPIDGWPGQYWVDIRSTVVRNIMSNRIAEAAAKLCDGVEMDDVDSYENDPGFPITAEDQINFNTFLATTAHANGLGIALKNDIDQVEELAADFDFAINEQCFQYDECTNLTTFINEGKAVFGVEYDLATSQFCSQANAEKFSWLKKDLNLDASRTQCCTTGCGGTWSCVAN